MTDAKPIFRATHAILRTIQSQVAAALGVPFTMITSACRERQYVDARAIAMYLTRTMTGASHKIIGKWYGGRHHTSVMYHCEQIATRMEADEEFATIIADIEALIVRAERIKPPSVIERVSRLETLERRVHELDATVQRLVAAQYVRSRPNAPEAPQVARNGILEHAGVGMLREGEAA